MDRLADWETPLAAYLAKVRATPHAYGRHDCLLFLAGAIKAMTGKDLGRGHRERYRTEVGAARYLRGLGFKSTEAMIDSLLEEKPVGFAQRGDVVLSDEGRPGLCMGHEALFVGVVEMGPGSGSGEQQREGLIELPRERWTKAWAV